MVKLSATSAAAKARHRRVGARFTHKGKRYYVSKSHRAVLVKPKRRRIHYRALQPSECAFLCDLKPPVKDPKSLTKWAQRGGHPDKGGDTARFQQVANCVEKYPCGHAARRAPARKPTKALVVRQERVPRAVFVAVVRRHHKMDVCM